MNMITPIIRFCIGALALSGVLFAPAWAGPDDFHPGPVISEFGKIAAVPGVSFDEKTHFKTVWDVSTGADEGKINRNFESVARFLNMHVANGVPAENIELAIVVHGSAAFDLLNDDAFHVLKQGKNLNAPLIEALLENNVRVILCGQTAAYRDITKKDMVPGVEISLSAMTAHALLQQQGYSLNPF